MAAATVLAASAGAQWTYTVLSQPGGANSFAWGVGGLGGAQQVGADGSGGASMPVIWQGPGGAPILLLPMWARGGAVYGTDGEHQVGGVTANSQQFPMLWASSGDGAVNLLPAGFENGIAMALAGETQVGNVFGYGVYSSRAALWHGTAASFVDLNPVWATASWLYGTDGTRHVGVVRANDIDYAAIWTGESPEPALLSSAEDVYGMATVVLGGMQAGVAGNRARLWRGTRESMVTLAPAGASRSGVCGMSGDERVGFVQSGYSEVPGQTGLRAVVWEGTAASMVSLHGVLPRSFRESIARGVFRDSSGTYVVGVGTQNGVDRAILWSRPGPSCGADFNGDGILDLFDYLAYAACFEDGDCAAQRTPDYNGDGFADFFDYADFVQAFQAGC